MKYEAVHSDDESDRDLDIETGELTGGVVGGGGVEQPIATAATVDTAVPSTPAGTTAKTKDGKKDMVSWSDLPRKGQLAVLTLARLSEPITQTSLQASYTNPPLPTYNYYYYYSSTDTTTQAYLFYQLKWFDPDLPDSTISSQAGVLHASFTAAQFVTALLWGRLSESWGRKTVLLFGLVGTCISCLGFGFATSFWQALLFRTLGGALNGNVGVLRTMISEIIREKKFQSRAFLLLPMTFNIGVVIGPVLGGVLSDPAGSYPDLFGHVKFLVRFPYAVPNLVSAVFLFAALAAVWLGLEETLDDRRGRPDLGIRVGRAIAALVFRRGRGRGSSSRPDEAEYASLPAAAADDVELEETNEQPRPPPPPSSSSKEHHNHQPAYRKRFTQRLAFRRVFTRNVLLTFMTHFFLAFHIGTFNSLWFVFLSTPVFDPQTEAASDTRRRLPFLFTGGVGMKPRAVGVSLAILGAIGITLQLVLFPRVSARLGTTRALRAFLPLFPLTYFLVPFLSVVPSSTPPPSAKTGPAIWIAIFAVLFLQVAGRTFALPSQTILVNNCSPHPSVLGVVHGLGQSVSSAARTIGPMSGGAIYGYGLRHGVVGLEFWILSCVAVCACLASLLLREGDGHEIWLEGDEEE